MATETRQFHLTSPVYVASDAAWPPSTQMSVSNPRPMWARVTPVDPTQHFYGVSVGKFNVSDYIGDATIVRATLYVSGTIDFNNVDGSPPVVFVSEVAAASVTGTFADYQPLYSGSLATITWTLISSNGVNTYESAQQEIPLSASLFEHEFGYAVGFDAGQVPDTFFSPSGITGESIVFSPFFSIYIEIEYDVPGAVQAAFELKLGAGIGIGPEPTPPVLAALDLMLGMAIENAPIRWIPLSLEPEPARFRGEASIAVGNLPVLSAEPPLPPPRGHRARRFRDEHR